MNHDTDTTIAEFLGFSPAESAATGGDLRPSCGCFDEPDASSYWEMSADQRARFDALPSVGCGNGLCGGVLGVQRPLITR